MLSLTTFAVELEREKARLRVTDAMQRKAKAGHVTGGRVFGYDNVEIVGPDGQRSHVERRINDREAAVVRAIFTRYSEGAGFKAIAHALNDQASPCPRSQQGRPKGWAPSSVREIRFRELYRGEIIYNRTKKRDTWGQKHGTDRPEADWIRVSRPELRIVTEEAWQAAHNRLQASAKTYLRGTRGRAVGASDYRHGLEVPADRPDALRLLRRRFYRQIRQAWPPTRSAVRLLVVSPSRPFDL